ncbi:uncharacterized protein [Haliotis cracherodii]|uniref:uncharacterized protein n=1 Tax=Haliotis cracherodii TaxID=6455 RepID=UPI0039E9B9CF
MCYRMSLCHENNQRLQTAKVCACFLLLLNLVFGIAVITVFSSKSPHTRQRSTDWEKVLEEVYLDTVDVSRQRIPEHADRDEHDDSDPDLQLLNLLKPVSHFSGLDFNIETADRKRNLTTLRNWANPDGSDRKLLYNGMSYENGSITVPAAGVYHITSHVKFYVEDNRKDDKPLQTFQHQVVRYSASGQTQVVLFENAVTECKEGINDGAHLEYPSDASGLAQLDAGDQVMVKVSHLQTLKHDRDWHSFDVVLI